MILEIFQKPGKHYGQIVVPRLRKCRAERKLMDNLSRRRRYFLPED